VSLKAREVLILGQMPSYEERRIQMESVLKNSVSNTYYGESGQNARYGNLLFVEITTLTIIHRAERRPLRFSRNSATLGTPYSTFYLPSLIMKTPWSALVSWFIYLS